MFGVWGLGLCRMGAQRWDWTMLLYSNPDVGRKADFAVPIHRIGSRLAKSASRPRWKAEKMEHRPIRALCARFRANIRLMKLRASPDDRRGRHPAEITFSYPPGHMLPCSVGRAEPPTC